MRDPKAIHKLISGDWAARAREKERYFRDWKREHGPAAGLRMADELRYQVLCVRPDWPSEGDRAEDLENHLRLIEVMRRVPPRGR